MLRLVEMDLATIKIFGRNFSSEAMIVGWRNPHFDWHYQIIFLEAIDSVFRRSRMLAIDLEKSSYKMEKSLPDLPSRYIPADVRHAVEQRDGCRCRFVAADGRRCRDDLNLGRENPTA